MKWISSILVAALLIQVGYVPCAAEEPLTPKAGEIERTIYAPCATQVSVYGTPGMTSVAHLSGKAQAFPGSRMPTTTADLLVLQSGKPPPLPIPASASAIKRVVKYAAIGFLVGAAMGTVVFLAEDPEPWFSRTEGVLGSGFLGALGGATATIFFKHSRDIERRSSGRLTIADYGLSEGKKGMYVTFSQVF